jgi:adenosine deaminase
LRDKFIGVGLDSSEVGHPPEKFAKRVCPLPRTGLAPGGPCRRRRPAGLHLDALDVLKVERIDHGVQAAPKTRR